MKNVSQLKPEHYMDHARASAVFTFSNVCHDPQCIYVFKNAMILVGMGPCCVIVLVIFSSVKGFFHTLAGSKI